MDIIEKVEEEMKVQRNCGCGNYSPKFIGLLTINWETGFCSLGFECQSCHKQGQSFQMLNLDGGLGNLFRHPDCTEVRM